MDGDARNGKLFFSDEEDDAGDTALPAFDAAAVMRAIAAEDEADEDGAPPAFDPARILRAIATEEDDSFDAMAEPEAPDVDGESALRAVRAVAAAFALSRDDEGEEAREEAASTHVDEAGDEAGHWAGAGAGDEYQDEYGDQYGDGDGDGDDAHDLTGDKKDAVDRGGDTDLSAPGGRPRDGNGARSVWSLQGHDGDVDIDDDPDDADMWPAAAAAPRLATMDELDLPGRKPRIALMGEFSAGKSTLSNLLIGARPLPMQVTATQLPPVWISWGDDAPYREDIRGETHPIDISRLGEIDPAETRVIRIFEKSEILEECDIIDMPGISDPNMASEVWERVIGRADGVIWCTHATQAWRQSEASVWETLDPKLFATSILLVTRFDKILSETDRTRVMRRVERETEGLFTARLPISLTRALAAGEDAALLETCGAAAFIERFFGILEDLARDLDTTSGPGRARQTLARDGLVAQGVRNRQNEGGIIPARILPRRVRPVSQPAPAAD